MDDPVAWVQARAEADPVRRRVLEALARRAAAQPEGALRERLLAKLVQRAEAAPAPSCAMCRSTAAPGAPCA